MTHLKIIQRKVNVQLFGSLNVDMSQPAIASVLPKIAVHIGEEEPKADITVC